MDKVSYALGLSIGNNFQNSGIKDLQVEDFVQGLNDVLTEAKPALSYDEAKQVINDYFMKLQQEKLEINKKAGEEFLTINKHKAGVILHNCIDTARFVPGPADAALRASLGFAPEDFVVLFCGRLEPDKGIHKLLEAMENIHDPRIKLLIVGSPFFGRTQQSPFLRKLEQQAETLGDRVRFTGYVPNDSMPEYYRLADLVCVPTLVEEAAGLVAVEAMGCGRPVLATRSGGMPEYLDGSQAVLVDRDGNVAGQLSFAIRMLYEHPDLRAQMSTAGAKTAQRYSSARFYDDFVRIVYDFGGHLWNSPSSV